MKENNLNNLIIFLKRAGLYDEAGEVRELANSGLLYHGSTVGGLKILKPMPSAVLDGESAVFATPERWMAISHIGSWTDSDIEQGVINGEPYMLEKKEGAFDRAYNSDSPGSLYSVSSEGFSDDSRLMIEERIRTSEVNVIDEEKIVDPLSEMESLGVKIIRADEAAEFYKDNFFEDWVADLEFQSYDEKGQVSKEAVLLRKASIEGTIPDFAWLDNGLISEMKYSAGPEAFDEFIDLNSDKFAVWNPIKYLGSGMVGDTWELDDGKVLKIFDSKTNLDDYRKYEKVMDAQWEGRSNLNFPMIYELGYLKMPSKFYSVRAPSRKNYSGSPNFAYVILEKVKTPQKILSDRLKANPNLSDPYEVYDEEADEWTVPREQETEYDYDPESGESQKVRVLKLKRDEVPNALQRQYDEALADENYDYFLSQFAEYMFHNIINQMHSSWEGYSEYLDEEFDEEDNESLDDEEHRDALIDSMVQSVEWSEFYSEESLSALERELSLAPGWENELAESVLNNLEAGRDDLHGLNFGFRNGKFVFFDA